MSDRMTEAIGDLIKLGVNTRPVSHFTYAAIALRGGSDWSCSRKQRYQSKATARRTMKYAYKHRSQRLRVYECPECHGWHMTSLA